MLKAPVHLGTVSKSATNGPVKLPATRKDMFSSTEKTKNIVTPWPPKSRNVSSFNVLISDPRLFRVWSIGYLGSARVHMVSIMFYVV